MLHDRRCLTWHRWPWLLQGHNPCGDICCEGGCRKLTWGSFADGSGSLEYGAGLYCYWVLAPESNASSILIEFEEFALESPSDHLAIYTCGESDGDALCADPVLFQALTGRGLPADTYLVVPSSRVLVTFETDHRSLRPVDYDAKDTEFTQLADKVVGLSALQQR